MLPVGCAAALAASASAFFLASLARRLRSASRLPEATRPGFFSVAGFVLGDQRSHGQGSWRVRVFLRELSRALAWPWPWCI